MKPWSMGFIGFSNVKGRLNCPALTLRKSKCCHSANASTTLGDEPSVEVLPLNWIWAFQ